MESADTLCLSDDEDEGVAMFQQPQQLTDSSDRTQGPDLSELHLFAQQYAQDILKGALHLVDYSATIKDGPMVNHNHNTSLKNDTSSIPSPCSVQAPQHSNIITTGGHPSQGPIIKSDTCKSSPSNVANAIPMIMPRDECPEEENPVPQVLSVPIAVGGFHSAEMQDELIHSANGNLCQFDSSSQLYTDERVLDGDKTNGASVSSSSAIQSEEGVGQTLSSNSYRLPASTLDMEYRDQLSGPLPCSENHYRNRIDFTTNSMPSAVLGVSPSSPILHDEPESSSNEQPIEDLDSFAEVFVENILQNVTHSFYTISTASSSSSFRPITPEQMDTGEIQADAFVAEQAMANHDPLQIDERPASLTRKRGKKLRRRNAKKLRSKTNSIADQTDPVLDLETITAETEAHDHFCCPVCLDIYYNPYICKPCDHIFCEPCLRRLAKYNQDERRDTTRCPICRVVISDCIKDNDTAASVQAFLPNDYSRRRRTDGRNKYMTHPLPYRPSPVRTNSDIFRLLANRPQRNRLEERGRQLRRWLRLIPFNSNFTVSRYLLMIGCLVVFKIAMLVIVAFGFGSFFSERNMFFRPMKHSHSIESKKTLAFNRNMVIGMFVILGLSLGFLYNYLKRRIRRRTLRAQRM